MDQLELSASEQDKEAVVNAVEDELTPSNAAVANKLYRDCLADMAVRLHNIPGGAAAANEAVSICYSSAQLGGFGKLPDFVIGTFEPKK